MTDDGRQPIAVGHMSDPGDLIPIKDSTIPIIIVIIHIGIMFLEESAKRPDKRVMFPT